VTVTTAVDMHVAERTGRVPRFLTGKVGSRFVVGTRPDEVSVGHPGSVNKLSEL
jgi:hypothetical protein